MTAEVDVQNTGAPTILRDIKFWTVTTEGKTVIGAPIFLGANLTLRGMGQPDRKLAAADYFPRKVAEDPIPVRGGRAGWVDGLFRGISRDDIDKLKLFISFKDVNGKPYTAEGRWGNRALIDPRTLQRH